jgi:hypothetical protein
LFGSSSQNLVLNQNVHKYKRFNSPPLIHHKIICFSASKKEIQQLRCRNHFPFINGMNSRIPNDINNLVVRFWVDSALGIIPHGFALTTFPPSSGKPVNKFKESIFSSVFPMIQCVLHVEVVNYP